MAALLAYAAAAWTLGPMLKLTGRDLLILRIGLMVLGVVSAAVILWFFRTPSQPTAAPDEIDAIVGQARARLAAARLPGKRNLDSLPLVLLVGPEGSAKTTSVVRAGLGAELLAGEALRGETVTPTTAANVWYGHDAVFVEAGGALAKDPSRFARLLRHLQPARMRAAVTGGTQAPRAAVVCFSCEELFKPGAGESIAAAARDLRARLGEAAQRLGIRLPVYVLFTKADAVPHFAEYVQHFTPEDARQVVGAGLAADTGPAGTYAERAGAAVSAAFEEIYLQLAANRLLVLHREQAPERKPGAYELPREFRKMQPMVVDFLRELCRPSQLAVSPVLRGFYFTGVQAVYVQESAAAAAPAAQAASVSAASSATQVFSAPQARAAAAASAYTPPSMRKVPRWNFLEGVFRDVVLADQSAMKATLGGTRLNFARRALYAGAAAAALLVAFGFTVSYANNRVLERDVADAARALAAVPPARADLPSVDALQRLDSVRSTLDRLAGYERDGAPLGMRWGLYQGGALYADTRRLYFDAFDRLLFGATRASLVASLRALPDVPSPTDDYGSAYDALKAHLITTSHPQHAAMDFLPDALLRAWNAGRPVDDARRTLARRQFETYTREVVIANPYRFTPDGDAVPHARAFLRAFQGVEPIYQYLLAEAAKTTQPVRFATLKPEAARVVAAPHEVPGAFTKGGWAVVQKKLQSPDALLKGEGWVVGEQAVVAPADRERTIRELRSRYERDYAAQWRSVLAGAQVIPFGLDEAVPRLDRLAGNQSPLLELFALVGQHTGVSPAIAKTFGSVRGIAPTTPTATLVTEKNQPYLQALGGLRDAVRAVVQAPPGPAKESAAQQAASSVTQVTSAVGPIALAFEVDGEGHVEQQVQRLLEQPPRYLSGRLQNVGVAQANEAGMRLCRAVSGVASRFPINPDAQAWASPQEIAEVLRPGTGTFWTVYNQSLTSVAVRQGAAFVQAPGASYRVSPQFLRLLQKMALLSDVLFPEGAQQPRVLYDVTLLESPRELSSVTLMVEGDPLRATQNVSSAKMQLPGSGREARLSVTQGVTESAVAGPYPGPWGVLRIFHRARVQQAGNALRFEWPVPNVMRGGESVKVAAMLTAGPAAILFQRDYLAGGGCPGTIAY